ncbi:flagellar hook-associated protein 3 FlgL [Novosphingobium sp. PhB165]|uniref:flagellin N-terminal helical domain-containing protein n=1 Tax=Novosphingobium sp. PhB165 TaxID=2485105 RepID=UPI00104289C0|nr:flagellar biosynthesis protein FlgL [Novosphingobium sp. PhB165]TCM18871.1 flagellar hook-associated protein 3 FlgL [Novosphingobium sp. PhB165]
MTIVSTSTSAFFDRSRSDIKNLRTQAENYQAQMSSGAKFDRSSDDPVAASRLRVLSRQEALSGVDKTNADRANADLSLADSTMSDMSDALMQVQDLATQASSSTLTDDQRASIGTALDQIFGNLLALANARDSNGHALFGGASAGDAYSLDASGNAVYVGSASSDTLPLGDGQSVTRSMTGPEFLSFKDANGNQTDLLAVVKGLSDALKGGSTDPTGAASAALTDLKTGLDTLSTGQTVVGTRLSWIEVVGDRRTNLSELRSTEESDIGGADLPTTIANLQETLTVLEAAQSTFGKLASLSLFNEIS